MVPQNYLWALCQPHKVTYLHMEESCTRLQSKGIVLRMPIFKSLGNSRMYAFHLATSLEVKLHCRRLLMFTHGKRCMHEFVRDACRNYGDVILRLCKWLGLHMLFPLVLLCMKCCSVMLWIVQSCGYRQATSFMRNLLGSIGLQSGGARWWSAWLINLVTGRAWRISSANCPIYVQNTVKMSRNSTEVSPLVNFYTWHRLDDARFLSILRVTMCGRLCWLCFSLFSVGIHLIIPPSFLTSPWVCKGNWLYTCRSEHSCFRWLFERFLVCLAIEKIVSCFEARSSPENTVLNRRWTVPGPSISSLFASCAARSTSVPVHFGWLRQVFFPSLYVPWLQRVKLPYRHVWTLMSACIARGSWEGSWTAALLCIHLCAYVCAYAPVNVVLTIFVRFYTHVRLDRLLTIIEFESCCGSPHKRYGI